MTYQITTSPLSIPVVRLGEGGVEAVRSAEQEDRHGAVAAHGQGHGGHRCGRCRCQERGKGCRAGREGKVSMFTLHRWML